MKELLKKHYGLEIEYSRVYQDGLIFFVNGDYYYLCKCLLNEEELLKCYDLYLLLKSKQLILHDFVFNNDNILLSDEYVLLKLNYLIDDIDIYDIEKFNVEVDFDYVEDFYSLWIDRIDYYEKELFVNEDNNFINYSFDYFIGLSETLLDYYKSNILGKKKNYVVHRSFVTLSTIDFYNPLNIIVGDRLKDYASYIRLTNNWDLLYSLLNNVTYEDRVYLLIRLSFPFKYFYCLNNYISNNSCVGELLTIVEDISKYEDYLERLELLTGIKLFYWIKKDN